MQPINTALCSFGMSGWVFHAPFIATDPHFKLYAVWERSKNVAKEKYPQIKFTATKSEPVDNDGSYEMWGDLTIKDVTKNVKLSVEFGGVVQDAYGNTKAGFTINGKINRKDFGITYGSTLETGGVLLGDEIKINAEIQLVKQVVEELVEVA